jgi:hypothetical protein
MKTKYQYLKMKTISLLAAITLLATSAFASPDCDLTFIRNPNLPRDCVELEWAAHNSAAIDCLYTARGVNRPERSDAVQVAVYMVAPDGTLLFLGWSWMIAEVVNELHQMPVAQL